MRLACDDLGRGPCVVLLHGFPLDRTMWQAQREALAGRHRVIVPDLRGHGESPPTEGTATLDALADDVLETLDALGVEGPFALGGLSMGGYVALSMAVRFPTRVGRLVLLDTRAGADATEAAQKRRELADRVVREGSIEPVVEAFLPRVLGPTTQRTRPDRVESVRAMMRRTSIEGAAACLRGMAERPDRTGDLPRMAMPALVVVGAEDAVTPPDEARAMADALPDARLVVIPGAGHLTPIEEPEATNQALAEFLDASA
jgi:3-oxoadipate enol-lactonase